MSELFGVFPDGNDGPAAVFRDLEEAIHWGLRRYGGDRFGIRLCSLELPATEESPCRPAA
jgi:hypothetical protein